MKISYSWLRQFIDTDKSPEDISQILTNTGLEVESLEKVQAIPGGLEGLVVGQVKSCIQHPNADRLKVTMVDIGQEPLLSIVCGAPNVAEGQKVIVAPVGTTVFPIEGEPFKINKSKIRGELSEGMICAEDEVGLGKSHAGILVLPENLPLGMSVKEHFQMQDDYVFEIGLTPNRADAASHWGVAKDLAAFLRKSGDLKLPSVDYKKMEKGKMDIAVQVLDTEACPRYSAICIHDVEVKPSPEWLQTRLRSIGLKPVNNIVDITNYVCHDLGQPLHAFDRDVIKGNKIIIKKAEAGRAFKTLDGIERKLQDSDLMICDSDEALCIAGVLGGIHSGVSLSTRNIFLESAFFKPAAVRKTARHHGIKTDASFRFERGTDAELTVFAMQYAARLIVECAGGTITSDFVDHYPSKIKRPELDFYFKTAWNLIGKQISVAEIKEILFHLGIEILEETSEYLKLAIPTAKVDVTREVDVIEEVLRIYGYNNIEIPTRVNASLSFSKKPDQEAIMENIADYLAANGFQEMMTNSLTASAYYTDQEKQSGVPILNPLSNDLDVLRQTMLHSGLEAIRYNLNRQTSDLKFFEFGKSYTSKEEKFIEKNHLSLFISGKKSGAHWSLKSAETDFYFLKSYAEGILNKLNITDFQLETTKESGFQQALVYKSGEKKLLKIGQVENKLLKNFEIDQAVYFADFDWDILIKKYAKNKIVFADIPKFPSVKRDLSMLIDENISFEKLRMLALQTERKLLKEVNIFDVYMGDKLPAGKKSYALSFILQDTEKTLTDKQIEMTMEKLLKTFEEQAGAEIRK